MDAFTVLFIILIVLLIILLYAASIKPTRSGYTFPRFPLWDTTDEEERCMLRGYGHRGWHPSHNIDPVVEYNAIGCDYPEGMLYPPPPPLELHARRVDDPRLRYFQLGVGSILEDTQKLLDSEGR